MFLEVLGGAWYGSPEIDPKEKDGQIVSTRFWITEIGEIDGPFASPGSASAWKAHISKSHDHIRLPYGREFRDYPRTGVMAGTTNADHFLPDATGARRHPVIHVTKTCDAGKLAKDRDQIWAEAAYLYRSGEQWHLDIADELESSARSIAMHGTQNRDPWMQDLRDWLRSRSSWRAADWFTHLGVEARWAKPADGARLHDLVTVIGGWTLVDGRYERTKQ
jgi:putative DNA primase/helicase